VFKSTIRKKYGSFDKFNENDGPCCSTLAKICHDAHCDYDSAVGMEKLFRTKIDVLLREGKRTEFW
jgi:hypothetical protein